MRCAHPAKIALVALAAAALVAGAATADVASKMVARIGSRGSAATTLAALIGSAVGRESFMLMLAVLMSHTGPVSRPGSAGSVCKYSCGMAGGTRGE